MAKFIKVQVEEMYQIPDEWELIKNEDGITKIKVGDKEYYDFGSIPYCSTSLEDEEEMMLTAEEYLDFQNRGLDVLLANTNISAIDDEKQIKELLELEDEF